MWNAKYLLALFTIAVSLIISTSVNAASMQEWCNSAVTNALDMNKDVNSPQFQSGEITYERLVDHYVGRENNFKTKEIVKQYLDVIFKFRGKVSEQDVINAINARCPNDYIYVSRRY